MPVEIYEIVALAARFWFLFLMFMIVWRSYRWYARERSQRKKRLRLLPDAGYIGELVVMQGAGDLEKGQVLSVPFEGTLGFVRSNDLCIPAPGVASRHLWFSYDERQGLVMIPVGRNDFSVDEITIGESPEGLCMAHGSRLYIGECELRLRMFAGYEVDRVMSPPSIRHAGHAQTGWENPEEETAGLDAYTTFVPGELYGAGDPAVAYGQAVAGGVQDRYAQREEPDEESDYDEPYEEPDFELPQEDEWAEEPSGYARSEPPAQESVPDPLAEDGFAELVDIETTAEGDLFARPMTSFAGGAHNPYARPVQPAAQEPEEMVFHPLLDDEDWDMDLDDMEAPAQPLEENRFAAAYRNRTVQAAARQAKETARQKADAAPEQRPAVPGLSVASELPAQPSQPRMTPPTLSAGPHMSRPGALTKPRPLAAKSSQGVGQPLHPAGNPADEAWPVVPRPDSWRSEGLFDDLVDEDGTDASAPPKSAYVGRDEAEWAKRKVWDKYFGGGDAP
ncbi:MAG: hypothetical protein E7323_06745 [Clostridiales bacterium]|nr:hypothetical protein [Clostridiales bacterium]